MAMDDEDLTAAASEEEKNDDDHSSQEDSDQDDDDIYNSDKDDHEMNGDTGITTCIHCKQHYQSKKRYHHDLVMCTHWKVQRINIMKKVNNILRATHITANRAVFELELAEVQNFMVLLRKQIHEQFLCIAQDAHIALDDPASHQALVYTLNVNVKLHPRTHNTIRRYLDEGAVREYEIQMMGENNAEHWFLHTAEYSALHTLATHENDLKALINSPFYHGVNINTWLVKRENETTTQKDYDRINTLFAPKGDMRYRMAMIIMTSYLIKHIILGTYK